MGKEIPLDVRYGCEQRYIVDGLTYEQLAAETGVSFSQLQRWGSEGQWADQRREHRKTISDIKRKSILLEKALVDKAFESLDPQLVYAAVRIRAQNAKNQNAETVTPDIDKPKLFLENLEFIAGVLKEIDPEGLKILAKSFDVIVARFKDAHSKTGT